MGLAALVLGWHTEDLFSSPFLQVVAKKSTQRMAVPFSRNGLRTLGTK